MMEVLETGRASKSFAVLSENSLPKTQLATKPNTRTPPTPTACDKMLKYPGQSGLKDINCAFAERALMDAGTGLLSIIMNIAPIKGAKEKAAKVIQRIGCLLTFSNSANEAR